MRREFAVAAVVAIVAALFTGLVADKIIEDFQNHLSGGAMWNQIAFILLVPAAFGALALGLSSRRDRSWSFVFVAGVASLAMAYAVGREFVNGLDQNDADKIAGRAWYGVMYFGGGMLIPLSVALGRMVSNRPAGRDKLGA